MEDNRFRFKKFEVSHSQSAMKVGVDAVLIGSWATAEGFDILDVGTGCGIIALMIAQRNSQAMIDAIDVDAASINEASINFENSSWKDRLRAIEKGFGQIVYNPDSEENIDESLLVINESWNKKERFKKYDLIISNPPFFKSGVRDITNARLRARHIDSLSPKVLLDLSGRILKPEGRLSFIFPYEFHKEFLNCDSTSLSLSRIAHVKNRASKNFKRTMMEFVKIEETENKNNLKIEEEEIIMFEDDGEPTTKYRELCKDFYLKF